MADPPKKSSKEAANAKVADFAKKVVEASRPKVNEPVSRPDRSTEWIRPDAYPETSDVTQRRQWEEKNSPASQKVQDFLNTPFHTTKDYVYPAGKEGWDTTASDAIADRYSIPRGPKRQGVTVRDTPPTDLGELDEPVRDMGEIDDPAPKTGTDLHNMVTQAIKNASVRKAPR